VTPGLGTVADEVDSAVGTAALAAPHTDARQAVLHIVDACTRRRVVAQVPATHRHTQCSAAGEKSALYAVGGRARYMSPGKVGHYVSPGQIRGAHLLEVLALRVPTCTTHQAHPVSEKSARTAVHGTVDGACRHCVSRGCPSVRRVHGQQWWRVRARCEPRGWPPSTQKRWSGLPVRHGKCAMKAAGQTLLATPKKTTCQARRKRRLVGSEQRHRSPEWHTDRNSNGRRLTGLHVRCCTVRKLACFTSHAAIGSAAPEASRGVGHAFASSTIHLNHTQRSAVSQKRVRPNAAESACIVCAPSWGRSARVQWRECVACVSGGMRLLKLGFGHAEACAAPRKVPAPHPQPSAVSVH
jgi:hypothetical protein